MADFSEKDRGTFDRGTAATSRGVTPSGASQPQVANPHRIQQTTPASNPEAAAALRAKQAREVALGIIEGRRYEFKTGNKSSWVEIGKDDARFLDEKGKPFLTLKRQTLREVLETTGDVLPDAVKKYTSSATYRDAQVNQYYDVFSDGNEKARNTVGSGQFRYDISKQHLADSVWNQLDHVATRLSGRSAVESALSQLADKNPGMECYGTTMLNVLKAKGLVPPTLSRQEFEVEYAWTLKDLPTNYRHHVLVGGGGVSDETRSILQSVVGRLSKGEWAQFTGMSEKNMKVQSLSNATDVAKKVDEGNSVFVGSPGHYRSAVGGTSDRLRYDDPLGLTGHLLYDRKPVTFGTVVEESRPK